jgi:hypothetical protein
LSIAVDQDPPRPLHPRNLARPQARPRLLRRYPKDRYETEVESWVDVPVLCFRVRHDAPARTKAGTKLNAARPYSNPEAAARKPVELANAIEAVQDGRIHVDNGPMLFELKATPAEYGAGLSSRSSAAGWWCTSGAYVKFSQVAAGLFA